MQLSTDQSEALRDIGNLLTSENREQILTGSPGSGKSFLTAAVIAEAEKAGYQLILAATTHQASKVMSDFTNREVVTIHKLLDLKVITDYTTNTTKLQQIITVKGPMISNLVDPSYPTFIIIDEASYIDETMHAYIDELLLTYAKIVILYVGDSDQLPPVGSEKPYVFNLGKPTSVLTTDHRFDTDSQMAEIVRTLKHNIQSESYFLTDVPTGKEITVLDADEFKTKMNELYTSDQYQDDPYFVKTVAYRNNVVDDMNSYIRKYFFDDPDYQPGERLIVNSAMVRKRKVLANNGDIVTVQSNKWVTLENVRGQSLVLKTEGGNVFEAIVTKDYRKKNVHRKKLVKEKKWPALYTFMESFIEVKSIYSSTIHKAQGASYTNVLLNLEDLVDCTDLTLLARLLLVAVSRAKEHVYVYGNVPKRLMRRNSHAA